MSIKITNNLKVHGESTTQKYTDAQYNADTQRINGAQPGTPISSKLMNTGLRNATLVTSALIEALKIVVPNDNDLTTAITIGTNTTHSALVAALTEALVKIKVETAILADNVKSGAIVEETTTARESKQGYGISLGVNSKLQFKTTWVGTHKNNDVLYYSTPGELKGFYIVKGLNNETTSQLPGVITIHSGDTPADKSTNLQRLTFETVISTDTNLSKTDTVSSSSTTNQLATAKAVYDYTLAYAQQKIEADSSPGTKILTKGSIAGQPVYLNKVGRIDNGSTSDEIPTASAVYNSFQTKITAGTANDILVKTPNAGVISSITKVTTITSSSTDLQIPTAKAVHELVKQSKVLWSGSTALSGTNDFQTNDISIDSKYDKLVIEWQVTYTAGGQTKRKLCTSDIRLFNNDTYEQVETQFIGYSESGNYLKSASFTYKGLVDDAAGMYIDKIRMTDPRIHSFGSTGTASDVTSGIVVTRIIGIKYNY